VTVYTKLTKSDAYGGGNHPARIFREIVDNIWALDPEWGKVLSESGEIPEMTAEYIGTRKASEVVPDLKGMGLMDAIYAIENNGFRCSYEGVGHVIRQTPNASARCSKGETIKIVLR
jgi:cell division protein FtsI (penicillin-binding protein 3)